MNKPWLGYLSSVFLLLAGILQFLAGKPILGALFTVLSIVGIILKIYLGRKQKEDDANLPS
jgi:TM2 domain-containing membrane protein YozV